MPILINSNLEPRATFSLFSGMHSNNLPKIVADIAARDALADWQLSLGVEVWCTAISKKYRLDGVGPRVWTDITQVQPAPAALYRVYPGCAFDTGNAIQNAINQAIVDGHTDNTNPAVIEVYPKVGGWTGNLVLGMGIHLVGRPGVGILAANQTVLITGTVTFAPDQATPTAACVVYLTGLQITAPAGTACIDLPTTVPVSGHTTDGGTLLIRDCHLSGSTVPAISMNSGSGGSSVYLDRSTVAASGTDVVKMVVGVAFYARGCVLSGSVELLNTTGGVMDFWECYQDGGTLYAMSGSGGSIIARFCRIGSSNNGVYVGNGNTFDAVCCTFSVSTNGTNYVINGVAGGVVRLGQCAYQYNALNTIKNVLTVNPYDEAPAIVA